MAGLTPFTVTAVLQHGIVLDARRAVTLDGLLASVTRAGARPAGVPGSLLDGGLDTDAPADWDLPLARCDRAGEWHWLCTAAFPVGVDGQPLPAGPPDVRRLLTRLDERRAAQVAVRVPAGAGGPRGRYRPRIAPVLATVAAAVTWRAVGDPAGVSALLDGLPAIGGRRGSGEGAVLAWQVQATAGDNVDADWFGHTHPDGTLGRPCPVGCAARTGATGWTVGVAGLRPPVMHPARQRELAVPSGSSPHDR